MKVAQLFETKIDWTKLVKDTKKELVEMFGENVSFTGGYCFHLSLALFLKARKLGKKTIIIGDGGHTAVFDSDEDISIDSNGVHEAETALNERKQRDWKTGGGFLRTIEGGFASNKQILRLAKVLKEFK